MKFEIIGFNLDCQEIENSKYFVKFKSNANLSDVAKFLGMPILSKTNNWALVGKGIERWLISLA